MFFDMLSRKPNWFRVALQVRGSVILSVIPQVLLCGGFGIFVSYLHLSGMPLAMPILGTVIPSIVLGLLLVFRTNTAYDRFWEGRKAWGELINAVRNLTRQIWIVIEEREQSDRAAKIAALHLLVAFAMTLKLHLRRQPANPELLPLVSADQYRELQQVSHPPLRVALWLEDYLHKQHQQHRIHTYQLTVMNSFLSRMVDAVGVCERILKTPIPLAYAIHLKQLLLIYCLLLPFQLVGEVGWWTGVIVALISFTLFGVEAIGIEIENPFGLDNNDLPLDNICQTMMQNIEELIITAPTTLSSHNGSHTTAPPALLSQFADDNH
jgi:putative membrane protein